VPAGGRAQAHRIIRTGEDFSSVWGANNAGVARDERTLRPAGFDEAMAAALAA